MASLAQWTSIAAAFAAAAAWFVSAAIKLPTEITVGFGGSGGSVQTLGEKLKSQSRWSAIAAAFAGVSAIAQGITQLLH